MNAVYAESDGSRLKPFVNNINLRFYRGNPTPMFAIWRQSDDPVNRHHVNAATVEVKLMALPFEPNICLVVSWLRFFASRKNELAG